MGVRITKEEAKRIGQTMAAAMSRFDGTPEDSDSHNNAAWYIAGMEYVLDALGVSYEENYPQDPYSPFFYAGVTIRGETFPVRHRKEAAREALGIEEAAP